MKSYLTKIMPLAAGAMISCGPDESSVPTDTYVPTTVTLDGSVQKGPFIQGSDVQIYPLDAAGNNLGSVYSTQTSDNLGNFSTTLAGLSPTYTGNLSLSGNGFFFKEVAGTLSDAQQTLKALYKAEGAVADININLVTHLSYQRAMQLSKNNSDLNASVAQAQNELVSSLSSTGLVYPSSASGLGTGMDLFGENNGANQYLLAVSCVFENAVGSSDSALQDLLNAYQLDLADDGVVASVLNNKIRTGVVDADLTTCVTNLQNRALELGVVFNIDANGINSALDTDLDGIVNSADLDIDGDGINNNNDFAPYNKKVAGSSYCEGTLCWELTPSTTSMHFYQATEHCENLALDNKTNWRLPTITELRSLVKGCADSETWGACKVSDDSAWADNDSSCKSCYNAISEGPGKNGCYWDSSLEGKCNEGVYWSSSSVADEPIVSKWSIDFSSAGFASVAVSDEHGFDPANTSYILIRCVRDNI